MFRCSGGGNAAGMPDIPEKRQSIRPPRSFLLVILAVLVVMTAVWFAVSAAVKSGGEDCPAKGENVTIERCR